MAMTDRTLPTRPPHAFLSPVTETPATRRLLIGAVVLLMGLFLILPLLMVFAEALAKGLWPYLTSFTDPDVRASIELTLLVAAIAVPANAIFGVAAAWAIAKFTFPGKTLLLTLIDLPFSVSPVIAGLVYVLLYGSRGMLGPWLYVHNLQIVFAVPGIVLATIFVTFPFVARELIPLMLEQGVSDEEAALSLGASGFSTFLRTTLPNIRWALLYGVLLCNARAMGEFGAVSVVSGHLRGLTTTMPLQIEMAYNEYNFVGAFATASLLAALALVTLIIKAILEKRYGFGAATARRG
jgi:sulfate transport system permease protein